jgi:hypothetical protein
MRASFLLPGVFAFAGLGVSLIAGAAWAQTDPASSSSSVIAQPQAAAEQSDSIDAQIAAWTNAPAVADDGSAKPDAGPPPPRQIHGEAGVAVGSNGYRAGYISTDIPLGRDSDLGIAVGESEIKPKHFGTIKDKSLAISLSIGGGDLGPSINCGSPTVAMDGRYLEPVWVSRMHGEALARDQMGCGGGPYAAPYGAPASGRPPAPATE